ncbi:MAG: dihydrofolate reductase family protein [Burkholderiales bacterium]
MAKVRVHCFGTSLDGFSAGPRQSLEHPLGERGVELMDWFFPTKTWRHMQGQDGGETGIDDAFAAKSFENVGAWILGRNMFGPVRGPWPDDSWKGWWGEAPPYRVPVFVLTHHARAPLAMKGGTEFRFVTDGIESALAHAKSAAGGRDVRVGGGTATVRAYLRARDIDEMHLAVRPQVLLGDGENLFAGLDLPALGYAVADSVQGERATHVVIRRR